jgi:t-SNARE complex subunit (syntaxin)
MPQQPAAPKTDAELKELEAKIVSAKRMKSIAMFVIIVIVVVIVALLYLTGRI